MISTPAPVSITAQNILSFVLSPRPPPWSVVSLALCPIPLFHIVHHVPHPLSRLHSTCLFIDPISQALTFSSLFAHQRKFAARPWTAFGFVNYTASSESRPVHDAVVTPVHDPCICVVLSCRRPSRPTPVSAVLILSRKVIAVLSHVSSVPSSRLTLSVRNHLLSKLSDTTSGFSPVRPSRRFTCRPCCLIVSDLLSQIHDVVRLVPSYPHPIHCHWSLVSTHRLSGVCIVLVSSCLQIERKTRCPRVRVSYEPRE